MDTSLERIRAKIAELESKIEDLRAAERVLAELDATPARRAPRAAAAAAAAAPVAASPAPASPAAPARRRGRRKASAGGGPRQTMADVISEALDEKGPMSASDLSEELKGAGRDITNRMVSFALQAMKKRGLARNVDGKWSSLKPRAK
ncbi:winged-helix domain-containing protein [Methylocella sp.]|uniref:winged-helix domain-containing protein n=1 Tax=Methylocella sp. TaxID=1978226 RepID=UPI0037845630